MMMIYTRARGTVWQSQSRMIAQSIFLQWREKVKGFDLSIIQPQTGNFFSLSFSILVNTRFLRKSKIFVEEVIWFLVSKVLGIWNINCVQLFDKNFDNLWKFYFSKVKIFCLTQKTINLIIWPMPVSEVCIACRK